MLLVLFKGRETEAHENQLMSEGPNYDRKTDWFWKPIVSHSISVNLLHLLEKKPGQIKFHSFDQITIIHFTRLTWGLNDELVMF